MDELSSALHGAREKVDPAWDPARARRAREVFHARQRRRRQAKMVLTVSLPAVVMLAALASRFVGLPGIEPDRNGAIASNPTAESVRTAADGPWHFWDGSTATPVDGGALLRAGEISPARIEISVERGAGRFEVTPGRADREFVVRSGGVTVRVVGTAFTVGSEGNRTRVSVTHGRVAVEWSGGNAMLGGGQSGLFPPAEAGAPPSPEPASASERDGGTSALAPEPVGPNGVSSRGDRNWRRLAESGDFNEAFEALSSAEVRDRPEELLLAADAARLSSHPREALPYYQRVVRDHAGDPRAPLAAFTMGRVLLTQLGRPREAATAFARARALAGGGSLAEDALAREVEARSSAGETERARSLAEEYVARYPAGQRIRAVRRFGGLP